MAKICALQLGTLSLSNARLDYYLRIAKEEGVNLVVLGEYVLNSFFTEFSSMPLYMLKEQSLGKISALKDLSKLHNLTIIAPVVLFKGDKIYKVVAKFSPNTFKIYEQNFLINYPHWDEMNFFDNQNLELSSMIFTHERVKFGVAFGFEAHFDLIWQNFMKNSVECVILPTACNLDSKERWDKLLQMRAFTNNIYILRVNRLGVANFGEIESKFYGHTMFINPQGEIEDSLDENEGLLIVNVDKKAQREASGIWRFKEILKKKDLI